jgi:hypothetical protein
MRNSDKPAFVKILNGLQSIKPGQKLTTEALEIWWMAMQVNWTIEEFTTAASHLACAVEFMPSPFHFEQLRKAAKPTTAEAWAVALKRCLDWRKPIEAPDVIDLAVAGIGGYRLIAMADVETSLPHVHHKFVEAYKDLDAATVVRKALPNIASPSQLPAPRSNSRDGRFAAIAAPASKRKVVEHPTALEDQSREQVTEWLQRAGQ